MKVRKLLILACLVVGSGHASAESDDQTLLKAFHEYGITKCNKFILEHSRLEGNWNYFISKHAGGIDGLATEVSITRVWGSENDTVKAEESYIQTAKACYVHKRGTTTSAGSCRSAVDANDWQVTSPISGRDYTAYENRGGVSMLAKDVRVGSSTFCIHEYSVRMKGDQG